MALAGTLEIQLMASMARIQADMNSGVGIVTRATQQMERAAGVVQSAFTALGLSLGVGAFAAMIKGSIDAADHLNDLSKSTGIAVEQLAGLRVAAEQSGGDLDSIAASINKLSVNIGRDGDKFRALGVTAKEPLEAFKQLADVFSAIQDPQLRAALGAETLGKSWAGAAPLLAEGGTRIGEMVEKGQRLAGMTEEIARQSDTFNDKLVLLTGTGGLANNVLNQLLPLVNALADGFLSTSDRANGLQSSFNPILEVFRVLAVLIGNVAFVIKGIVTEVQTLGRQFVAFATRDAAGFTRIHQEAVVDAEKARVAFDRWERSIMNVGTAAQTAADRLGNMDRIDRLMASNERAAAREASESASKKAKALLDFAEAQKKAADEYRKLQAEEKRLRELDNKGWVAYIEAMTKEYEDGLKQLAKDDEDATKAREKVLADALADKKRMQDIDARGWVAYVEAMTQEYEDGLRAISAAQDEAAAKMRATQNALTHDLIDSWRRAGADIADSMTKAFGQSGVAAGGMVRAFADAVAQQTAIAAAYEQQRDKMGQHTAKQTAAYQNATLQNSVGMYAGMAESAAGFFEKNSDGYNVMMAASKAFHIAEIALQIASIAPKLMAGAATMFGQSGWGGFAGVAAMGAVMAGLGYSMANASSEPGQSSASRQQEQGTGTVLGDSSAKSQSLLNAIKEIEKTDKLGLVYSHDMLEALRAIQSSMGALASLIFRTSGVTTGGDFGVQTGTLSRNTGDPLLGMLGINDSFLTRLDPILGGFVSALQGLWGKTTQEITDAGVLISGTVGQLMRGQGISQYANVTTNTSSWFGLVNDTSNSTLTAGVSDRLSQQFALIFGSIIDSIESAAKALDMWSPKFAEDLRNFVVEIDKISLQGLQGQDLQDALNSVFSTFADKVSLAFFGTGEMQDLAKAGEGFYETLIRVATGNEYVKQTFAALGLDLPLVGMAAVTARMELIDLAGGLEAFGKITQDYYSKYYSPAEQYANTGANLGAEFNRLGVAMPTDPAGLRALIESIGTATPEARALTIELMKLAGVFYDYSTAVLGLDGQMHTLDETTRQHRDLEEELAVLNGTKTAQFVERSQRIAEAIDATSLATLQAIFVEEDRQAGLANLAAQNEARWDLEQELLDLTQTESEALERQRSLRMTELSLREQELGMAPDSLQAIQRQINAQTDLNAARDAEALAMKTTADLEGRLGVLRGDYTQQELDRAREWQAAADGYDKALLTQIYAMEDAKKAAEELAVAQATALDTEIELRGRLFELTHTEGEVLERNRQIRLDELRIMEITGRLVAGTLTSIQEQIYAQEDLNAAMEATTATFQDFFIGSAQWWDQQVRAAEEAARAAAKAAEDALKAAKAWSGHLTDWLNSNALSDLSPLTAQQQLLEAQRQYDLAKLGGDAGALTAAADMLLAADKAVEGFGGGYSALYAQIRADLAGLAESGPVATVGEAQIVTAVGELRKEVADAKVETARLLERLIEATRDGSDDVSNAVNKGSTKQAAATDKAAAIGERR